MTRSQDKLAVEKTVIIPAGISCRDPGLLLQKQEMFSFWNKDGLVSVLWHIHKSPCTFTIGQFSVPTVPRIIAKERKSFGVGSFCLACKRLRPWGFACFGVLANLLLNDPAGWTATSCSESPLCRVLHCEFFP